MVGDLGHHLDRSLVHWEVTRLDDRVQDARDDVRGQHCRHCRCAGLGRALNLAQNY